MKKFEVEGEKVLLEHEKHAIAKLKSTYSQAQKDINAKVMSLEESIQKLIKANPENETLIRSKIYQLNYQKALQEQIGANLDLLKDKHVKTMDDYLNKMYEDGYLTNIYNLQKYGIPVTVPINQDLLIKAVTYPVENIPLSKRLYENLDDTKRKVISEIARGINTGASVNEIARNIKNKLDVSFRKARQIAQNEGKRVSTEARIDSMRAAKKKGADIVKVWDATLDNKTRPVHAELDQKHAEIDEPFKFSGGEVQAPKQFGIAALDINCRCALLSVPRWDLEDTVQKRDNITGELIEAKNYDDWKKKYHKELLNDGKSDNKVYNKVNQPKRYNNIISDALGKLGVLYNQVIAKNHTSTIDEIVNNLGGGDNTSGSCASVALAYIGQKFDYDVLDFRGGASMDYFSSKINKIQMFKELGVNSIVEDSFKSNLANGKKILSQMQIGKEYYLSVGRHASIVRKTNNGYQYLELQSPKDNGWKDFDSKVQRTLEYRFGCTSSSRYYSKAYLTDIEQLKGNNEFIDILGYINTDKNDQKKGQYGTIK